MVKKMSCAEKDVDQIMRRVFANQLELNQLGFDVVVGTDYEGQSGMLEMKVRKRVEEKPKLKILKFFGLRME